MWLNFISQTKLYTVNFQYISFNIKCITVTLKVLVDHVSFILIIAQIKLMRNELSLLLTKVRLVSIRLFFVGYSITSLQTHSRGRFCFHQCEFTHFSKTLLIASLSVRRLSVCKYTTLSEQTASHIQQWTSCHYYYVTL